MRSCRTSWIAQTSKTSSAPVNRRGGARRRAGKSGSATRVTPAATEPSSISRRLLDDVEGRGLAVAATPREGPRVLALDLGLDGHDDHATGACALPREERARLAAVGDQLVRLDPLTGLEAGDLQLNALAHLRVRRRSGGLGACCERDRRDRQRAHDDDQCEKLQLLRNSHASPP